MSHTLVQDVESRISDVESAIRNTKEGYVVDLEENLDNIAEELSSVESELVYVNDELEDAENQLDEIEGRFGSRDPDDWDLIDSDEGESLKADFERVTKALTESEEELAKLRVFHGNQSNIISALLLRLRDINQFTSEAEIVTIMQDANPVVTDGQ